MLGNVTDAIVNVDEFRIHANYDGSMDKTKTDLYLHFVNRIDHSILDVDEILRVIDQNTEKLDLLFKVTICGERNIWENITKLKTFRGMHKLPLHYVVCVGIKDIEIC